jgi:hypothetical protein
MILKLQNTVTLGTQYNKPARKLSIPEWMILQTLSSLHQSQQHPLLDHKFLMYAISTTIDGGTWLE